MKIGIEHVKDSDTSFLASQGFYPSGGCDMYADYERVRPEPYPEMIHPDNPEAARQCMKAIYWGTAEVKSDA